MTDTSEMLNALEMEAFSDEVKDALQHLYDFVYLQAHPLTRFGDAGSSMQGQWLRREIITAIEALAPAGADFFRTPQARPYQLLQLRYVEGMMMQEAARELGVSERQAYRDLKRGESNVAALLFSRWRKEPPTRGQMQQLTSIESEVAGVTVHRTPTLARTLIDSAIEAVGRLAQKRGVEIRLQGSAWHTSLATDPSLGVHLLTKMLSHAIQHTFGSLVAVNAAQGKDDLVIQISYATEEQESIQEETIVVKLAERLGWAICQRREDDPWRIALRIGLQNPTVLIVDDNRGLVEMLDRFLSGHACRVVSATSGQEGLGLIFRLHPQAVILDVMMPDIDGWQVLQRIRAHPDTADIPVIICSVFDDPELAYSLGTSLFLKKPIRRADVLAALRKLGIV